MTKARQNADNFAADITGVTAGTGITGGGTSGAVTVTNSLLTTIDAAGDLLYGTGNDAAARLAIGTAGQLLAVNSGATAPEWVAAPAAGGMTLIAATATDGLATIDFTAIPGTFEHLLCVWDKVKSVNATSGQIDITLNNLGSPNYLFGFTRVSGVTVSGSTTPTAPTTLLNPQMDAAQTTQVPNSGHIWIFDYASTTQSKPYLFQSFGFSDNFSASHHLSANGRFDNNAAVTSLKFVRSGLFANGGLIRLYGVN